MNDKFKTFNVTFHVTEEDYLSQTREERLDRVYARSMIRGMLMFNDLDLAEDPWDYDAQNARKSGGIKPDGTK